MKIYSFFKFLNHKIKQYEKAALNPFMSGYKSYPLTYIWVEDANEFTPDERSSEQP